MALSKLFTQIYRSLPPESQQALVEDQLVPLLDTLRTKKRDRIIRALQRTQARYDGIPKVDLPGKKREMQILFMLLSKDDKVAFTRERSNREELLQEAVHSISSWLSKIWLLVFEYKANFDLAHECLLFAVKSLTILEESPGIGDCKCLFNGMHIALLLKDRQKRTLKYFTFTGARNLDQACMWIWRDLFLCMLVDDRRSKSRVKEMLGDIEELMGWNGLEEVIYGGRRGSGSDDDDDDYDEDDDEDYNDDEEAFLRDYEEAGTDDEYDRDSEGEELCCCRFHAKYWSDDMNEQRITLRNVVKTRLIEIFHDAPDVDLYSAINAVSQDPSSRTTKQLLAVLSEVAGDSADTLRVALRIHTDLFHPRKILKLLENYYHYLRPNDCPILLAAISVLADSSCRPHALRFVERELLDTVQHIYSVVRASFSHYPEEVNQTDLADILKLASSSPVRPSRIERWVDRALTPAGSEPMGPMAFAAMMMGFPVGPPPPSLDETDLLAYIDLNKPDPDLDILREEFKPPLKPRFESWNLYSQTLSRDAAPMISRVYAKVVELMPFFKATDVVAEMANRIADRPGKSYVHDAMTCLSAFCKVYRKKHEPRRRTKKAPAKATAASPPPPSSNAAAGSSGGSSTTNSTTNPNTHT